VPVVAALLFWPGHWVAHRWLARGERAARQS